MRVRQVALILLITSQLLTGREWRPKRIISMHYPCLALRSTVEGLVRLHVVVGEDGRPKDVKVVLGHPLLLAGAIENVKQWTFQRVARPGAAAGVVEMNYLFRIHGVRKQKDPDVEFVVDLPTAIVVSAGFDPKVPCEIPPRE